jgi:hypothetical protein
LREPRISLDLGLEFRMRTDFHFVYCSRFACETKLSVTSHELSLLKEHDKYRNNWDQTIALQ